MAHRLSPEDLHNTEQFELIQTVRYSEMKDFVLSEIQYKTPLIKVYSIVQILALLLIFIPFGYFVFMAVREKTFSEEVDSMFWATIFSFTLLIPIHEGIHALAFLLLGKRDISFGVQWKRFLFYAESNRQVLDRKQMLFVAIAPLVVVSFLCLLTLLIFTNFPCILACSTVFLIHIFFCSGDLTIVSFFTRHKPFEVFTYDDRKLKTTFYFKKEGYPEPGTP